MNPGAPRLVCAGCGATAPDGAALPFRCPNAGADEGDHVLTRVLDPALTRFPDGDEPNPFVRYRRLLYEYQVARAGGMSDADYQVLVGRLDQAVATVDGRGFRVTPFEPAPALSDALGLGLWIKDETGNVSGSHKARHLFGIALYLEIVKALGRAEAGAQPPLAIASCGNAALAAAVVARAAGRELHVFIPPDADPVVVARLAALGARTNVCHREAGVTGDPCYLAFRRAVLAGALPFCCQGPDNGLTIDGGRTLGYEMISRGVALDAVFIQVGGGALASSVVQAFEEARLLGAIAELPRFFAVQTDGAYPLARALSRLMERMGDPPSVPDALRRAAAHRADYMWPWESEPASIAHGILDDETYDWLAIARGVVGSGGVAVVVSEEQLVHAHALAHAHTTIDADHTGTAGLAGLLAAVEHEPFEAGENVAVIFSGVTRS